MRADSFAIMCRSLAGIICHYLEAIVASAISLIEDRLFQLFAKLINSYTSVFAYPSN